MHLYYSMLLQYTFFPTERTIRASLSVCGQRALCSPAALLARLRHIKTRSESNGLLSGRGFMPSRNRSRRIEKKSSVPRPCPHQHMQFINAQVCEQPMTRRGNFAAKWSGNFRWSRFWHVVGGPSNRNAADSQVRRRWPLYILRLDLTRMECPGQVTWWAGRVLIGQRWRPDLHCPFGELPLLACQHEQRAENHFSSLFIRWFKR